MTAKRPGYALDHDNLKHVRTLTGRVWQLEFIERERETELYDPWAEIHEHPRFACSVAGDHPERPSYVCLVCEERPEVDPQYWCPPRAMTKLKAGDGLGGDEAHCADITSVIGRSRYRVSLYDQCGR